MATTEQKIERPAGERQTVPWPQDSTRVAVDDREQVGFWTKRFRVSEAKLRQAIRSVGSNFKDVMAHLNSKR